LSFEYSWKEILFSFAMKEELRIDLLKNEGKVLIIEFVLY